MTWGHCAKRAASRNPPCGEIAVFRAIRVPRSGDVRPRSGDVAETTLMYRSPVRGVRADGPVTDQGAGGVRFFPPPRRLFELHMSSL